MTAPKTKRRKRSTAEQLPPSQPLTRLRPTACRQCGRPIHAGHLYGEPVRIDGARINATGELVALLRGSRTYRLNSRADDVYRRRAYHITNDTPPKHGYVHADHDCELIWAASHYDLRDLFPVYRGEEAPF